MTWWIIGGAVAVVLLLLVGKRVASTRKPTAQQPVQVQSPVDQKAPSTVLELCHRMLANKDYTANATALLTSGSKAVSRILLCLGFVLVLIISIVMGLAWLLAPVIGPSAAIGSGIAVAGTSLLWAGRTLWKRFSPRQQTKSTSSRNRRTTS